MCRRIEKGQSRRKEKIGSKKKLVAPSSVPSRDANFKFIVVSQKDARVYLGVDLSLKGKKGGDKRRLKGLKGQYTPNSKYATLCERSARLSRPARSIGVERCSAGRPSVAEADHSTVSIVGTGICKIGVLSVLMMVIIAIGWQARKVTVSLICDAIASASAGAGAVASTS
jgi:hypothetical protein